MDRTRTPATASALVAVLLAGAAVSLTLGVLGARFGEPRALDTFGFTSVQSLKAWVSTVVLVGVLFQVVTARWMYGGLRFLGPVPAWLPRAHRWSGRLAVVASLPVAFYCLYGFGFDASGPRVLAHSIAGCVFYGAFVAKMLALRSSRTPSILLPVLGGLTFTAFVAAWWLAALWWFQLVGLSR